MSIYQKITEIGPKFISMSKLVKFGFNLSPMYRRTTAKVTYASDDLMKIQIRIPISYKNKNYVGTIFGGSMFSSVDPFPMTQLINLLGKKFVVWDKSAQINFKAPANEDLYADFIYTKEEVEDIRKRTEESGSIDIIKTTLLTNKDKSKVFCEVHKTIYVATKAHYKEKLKKRTQPK